MSAKIIHSFTCRSDNFAVFIHDPQTGLTAAIDAPDAKAMEAELDRLGWRLSHILITHHHEDHVAGVEALRARFPCQVIGHAADRHRLPPLDLEVQPDQALTVMGEDAHIIATPGHTSGQIAYYFPGLRALFAADCLFSLGCGRLFEGTASQMWAALDRLRKLPGDTALYCGHEYTQANAKFALSVEPGNPALQARAKQVHELRARGEITLPSMLADECATNPFLRPESPEIRAHFGLETAGNEQVFAALRQAKDRFA
ncbi:MAG: hydroxyacylglutathione hydrolase [Aestuariivirgaceae bacterium]|jgi:hydroxyacylglutathione hydrolase|nr:hydroxyacylglutathione hydrolase [Aestuariivirgaceae bacterium]